MLIDIRKLFDIAIINTKKERLRQPS